VSRETISVVLPDETRVELPAGSSSADLAAAIGPGLARAAIAARVDGELHDLGRPLEQGARVLGQGCGAVKGAVYLLEKTVG
jgi:threonyl-tRNA synthetase